MPECHLNIKKLKIWNLFCTFVTSGNLIQLGVIHTEIAIVFDGLTQIHKLIELIRLAAGAFGQLNHSVRFISSVDAYNGFAATINSHSVIEPIQEFICIQSHVLEIYQAW